MKRFAILIMLVALVNGCEPLPKKRVTLHLGEKSVKVWFTRFVCVNSGGAVEFTDIATGRHFIVTGDVVVEDAVDAEKP